MKTLLRYTLHALNLLGRKGASTKGDISVSIRLTAGPALLVALGLAVSLILVVSHILAK